MTYKDFWNAPKAIYGSIPGSKKRNEQDAVNRKVNGKSANAKGSNKKDGKVVNGQSTAVEAERPSAAKRKVSFQDQVKVQEFESAGNNKSAIAALVKKVGMKQALKKLSSGELDDEDVEGFEGEGGDEDMGEDDEDEGEDGEDSDGAEDDDGDDESMADSDGGDAEARTMRRLQTDLLAEDDDASSSKKDKSKQSRYEQRMSALSEQIAELEAENVAEREWAMRGEINSRARPINSLLEEDLEFDQVAKVVPVVTEESSLTLEDKIKKRILDVSSL
jgi:U3 small nucleolar RNA-associated protein MPP10